MAKFNRIDLEHVLRQILMAEAGQLPVNPHLAFGLRQVNGQFNNSVPGHSAYGAADRLFPRVGDQLLQSADTVLFDLPGTIPGELAPGTVTSYTQTQGYVWDADPRVISNLIADQTALNPAALAAQNLSTPGTGYLYQHGGAQLVANPLYNPNAPEGLDNLQYIPNNVAISPSVDAAGNLFIANVTPDAGLSAPFNSWMTFFGQFFDHGLDLVSKGGNGFVFMPLQADDPLILVGPDGVAGTGDELTNPGQQFMMLTRATQFAGPGADGILGDDPDTVGVDESLDDTTHEAENTTTPFVDQNQTYSSHPAHQVFLREYARFDSNGAAANGWVTVSTGKLLNGADGKSQSNWAEVKANALKLGIILNDTIDVVNIPLVKVDAWGNFIPGANGLAQLVTALGADGMYGTADDVVVSGTVAADGTITAITTAGALRTGHAFLNDISHTANPVNQQTGAFLNGVSDGVINDTNNNGRIEISLGETALGAGNFDVDLLNRHFIAGDGRVNENIGLIAVHEIFHSEHNRQIELIKAMVRAELDNGDTAFAIDWTLPGVNLADGIADNEFNGQRLFQAAKYATETQYQHIVFEEFARKISPNIHAFGNNAIELDPAITAEFAHAVYRFGHSMLTETVSRYVTQAAFLNPDGTPTDVNTGRPNPLAGTPTLDANGDPIMNEVGLIQAFLNPVMYAAAGGDAAANIVLGNINQVGNEIDEFVTGALRNNLVGLPMDLAALNIARGRDTGVPTLNFLRNQIFTALDTGATGDTSLKPYASWDEFGQFLKHAKSLVNFIAAYGTHASITGTLANKRDAAQTLVDDGTLGSATFSQDAYNFLHSVDSYANNVGDVRALAGAWSTGSVTGLDHVDLWIGGLAEKLTLFGGLLGSTFNFIFETQMEAIQDGDRLYYLPRVEGIEFGTQVENGSFAELIMLNTSARHLPASIFLTPEYTIEASNYFVRDYSAAGDANGFALDINGNRIATDPSNWQRNAVDGNLLVEVLPDGTVHFIGDDNFFGNTMVLGGTPGDDRLQAGQADDDTVWGDAGNDWIDGGNGNNSLYGGEGDDTIQDSAGDDVIHADAGNDTVDGGLGDDIIFGGDGDDLLRGGNSIVFGDEILGGAGNDIILGQEGDDALMGNEGDDWIEGGVGGDGIVGDVGAPTGQIPLYGGNDVLDGGAEGDKMTGFSGDDIMLGEGGFDKFYGKLGFDWASYENSPDAVSVDMDRREFIPDQQIPAGDAVRDVFHETEGVSGSAGDDYLKGSTDVVVVDAVTGARTGGAASVFNELQNVDLIFGLANFFPVGPVNFTTGNIMLGGDGNDRIEGRAGDDIIDGDAYLHVSLTRDNNGDIFAGSQIVREIMYDVSSGDVDTAVFSDVLANYQISAAPDAQGFYTITQIAVTPGLGLNLQGDGVDRIRNIERLQFSDQTISINAGPNDNQVPTGALTIDNNAPAVGSVLTAASTLTDTDAMGAGLIDVINDSTGVAGSDGIVDGTLQYQWQYQIIAAPNGTTQWLDYDGATSATFTVPSFVLGTPVRVRATFVDGLGYTEHAWSPATAIVTETAGINTAPFINQQQNPPGLPDTSARAFTALNLIVPVITVFNDAQTAPANLIFSATLSNGQALDGSAAANGLLFTTVGDGAGGVAYGLITGLFDNADIGAIPIRVTATDTGPGTPLSITDTFIINVLVGNAPPIAGAFAPQPLLEGNSVLGGADTFSGFVTGSDPEGAPIGFRLVAGSAFGGTVVSFNQNTGAFTFLASDGEFVGQTLPAGAGFDFTVTDGSSSSAPGEVRFDLTAVNDGDAPFALTGTAAVGQELEARIGEDPDGAWNDATASYQWYRDGVAIGGPVVGNAFRTVTAADVGHALHVVATYADGQGFSTTVTSAPTAPIGVLEIRAIPGLINDARITVFNSITDPDGNPDPGNVFYDWETSVDGVNWVAAGSVAGSGTPSADGLSLTLNNNTTRFVRTNVNYIDGAGNLGSATSASVRVFTGGLGGQGFLGNAGVDFYFGLAQADTVNTGGGNDVIIGGTGADNLTGGAGNDTFLYTEGDGADTMNGGTQTDTVIVTGTGGNDEIVVVTNAAGVITNFEGGGVSNLELFVMDLLGGNNDLLQYNTLTPNTVSVDLGLGSATGFSSIAGVENVIGGGGADILVGNASVNELNGGAGGDTLTGGIGADEINTGVSNDNVIDLVRFSNTNEYGDTVTNFDSSGTAAQIDRAEFGGALNTLFDDGNNDDNFAFVAGDGANGGNTAVNLNGTVEALYLSGANGEGVTTGNLDSAGDVATEFNAEFALTANNGEATLLVINDTGAGNNSFAVWQWIQAGGGEMAAAELTLIGVFTSNATVTTGSFDFFP